MSAKKGFIPGYASTIADKESKQRYTDKLRLISSHDPYELPGEEWQDNIDMWPAITFVHVCMYLILFPSPYSKDDMLNYKSLDSFKNFQNGWVRELLVKEVNDKRIMIAKVNHSQRMSEKPLVPWIIAEPDGKILAANCNCMAGLGETCSHVASLLWATAAGVEKRDSLTVTQKSAYWVMPPAIKTVPYAPLAEISFIGKKRKSMTTTGGISVDAPIVPKKQACTPSGTEKAELYDSLAKCEGCKPAVLAIVSPYSEAYIPASLDQDLPMVLSDLHKKEYLSLGYSSLLQIASETKLQLTVDQAKTVEVKTRDQAKSRVWFRMRAGRITASKFKNACCTDPANPSKSLIMSLCYPEVFRFSNEATKWGCQHEQLALEIYSHRSQHENVKVSKCGFFISINYPFLGASPDGIVECSCCGKGVCEVKCPYCHRDESIEEATEDGKFCLEKLSEGRIELKRNHAYYYQVQAQLLCTESKYCDFIVYTNEDIHVERIELDLSFLDENLPKAKTLFQNCILPELLGRWFSRPPEDVIPSTSSPTSHTPVVPDDPKYCYCQKGEYGEMVGCDNSNCCYQWFHLDCLNLTKPPKGKIWYCPDCRKLDKFMRKSKCKK